VLSFGISVCLKNSGYAWCDFTGGLQIDYSLNRWSALTHYLNDPQVPIDNNWVENQIRP